MSPQDRIKGLALRCDLRGIITEVLQNTLGLRNVFQSGKNFTRAVHQGSFSKALNFLTEIQTKGALLNWDFYVQMDKQLERLYLSGIVLGEDLFLIGAKNRSDLIHLFQGIIPGGKEFLQRMGVDKLEEPNKKPPEAPSFSDDDMYDQLTVLYNEMTNLQRQLSKKNVELQRMSKQKDQFLGMAAHELRHPLGIIQMLSGFLLDEAASMLDQEQIEYLSLIKTYTESMQRLLDEFLNIAIIESGRLYLTKKPTNLIEVFKKNLALSSLLTEKKKVKLDLFHDDDIPMVMVDGPKIEQVLNNLISNALKSSPEESRIEIYLHHSGSKIVFKVKDQGSGISPELLPKLFEPFEKSLPLNSESPPSSGLGLAIARKIVEAHEGRIWVESEVDKGSTFSVSLPIKKNSS
jgi:signal transduction histidine kinase